VYDTHRAWCVTIRYYETVGSFSFFRMRLIKRDICGRGDDTRGIPRCILWFTHERLMRL